MSVTLASMFPATSTATVTVRRSTRFVAWVRAWRAGLVPYDEVAGEIAGDEEHLVAEVPGTWAEVPLGEVLSTFARLHPDEIRLVLPVPGDPRGLPGPGAFTGAALVAQECVIAGELGLVPEVRTHTSGSGDTFCTVLWRLYPLPTPAAGAVAAGAPDDRNFFVAEEIAGDLYLPPVFQLEGNVVHLRALTLDEIDGVMVGPAAHEHEPVLDPIRHAKAEHTTIEIDQWLRVGNHKGQMA